MIAIPLLTHYTGGAHASRRGWIIIDEQTGERTDFVDAGGVDPGSEIVLIDWCHDHGMLHAQLVSVTRPIRVSQAEYDRWAAADPPRAS